MKHIFTQSWEVCENQRKKLFKSQMALVVLQHVNPNSWAKYTL
jgi:hypothetical protein